ncbi:hypothetical protein [Virgisporangium aurantiacum]|uniref:Uncharacterized protein n=1 Tax=Virgisporangium aurantiacum TaxID=175570 RepID=A0A8J3ZNA3_9ACTN|nr:hypothetical protein [Virgisporangium aurantiacum]GIJ64748.1 hypothetical protein Vau01_122640 [Virgisporangium aurantiacum]
MLGSTDANGWAALDRTQAALDHAETHPGLAGPLALRRTAPHTYTVGPRLDVLTDDQRTNVLNTARCSQPLTVEQANVLLAALVLHRSPRPAEDGIVHVEPETPYREWRQRHLDAERELRARGLLHADHRPDSITVSPTVTYSLRYRETPTGF